MKFFSLAVAAIALASPGVHAECLVEKPMRITTVNVSPSLAADSFARKPKVLYRVGKGKARLEEQADPRQKVHLLIVVDMPAAFYVDLVAKTAQSVTDDPDSRLNLPVISDDGLPAEVLALEFGCEARFIADLNTIHERKQTASGVAMKHSRVSGPWKLTLATREDTERPVAAVLTKDGKVEAAIQYLGYETLESIPDEMFKLPRGVKVLPPEKR